MKHIRISTKMSMIFLGFALLVLISVGVTSWGLNAQKVDGVIINLAGRQRMLVQQMTRLVLEIERDGPEDHLSQLQDSELTFAQTLNALRNGGTAPYLPENLIELPKTNDPQILTQIDLVEKTWQSFQDQIHIVENSSPGSPDILPVVRSLVDTAPVFVEQLDEMVHLYEMQSTAKVTVLRQVQIIFLVSALALLITGVWIVRRFVLQPLQDLGAAAQRIGMGDLEVTVQVGKDEEIALLSTTMEDMRSKLLISQRELQSWANTLEERVAQRTQELEALNAVSQEIGSRLDLNHVLNSLVEKSRQLLNADAAFLCILDDQKHFFSLQSTSGITEAVADCVSPAESDWATRVITGEQAVRCDVNGCQSFCRIVAQDFRTSHLAAPLCIGRRIIGALCVASRQPDFFTDEAVDLLTRLANIASVALENARLYAQLERSSTLEERHRIAAEMHDGLAQTLSFLSLTTDQTREMLEAGDVLLAQDKLDRLQRGILHASDDIRRAIASLQEGFPTQYTLQEQLDSLINEFSNPDLPVIWENKTHVPLVLGRANAEQVLRVVREALINAQKHSHATQVSVSLVRSNGSATVTIEDNGIGFNPQGQPVQDERPHFGLKIMQARAANLGGQLEIHSPRGEGTCVVLSWELKEE